MVSVDFEEFSFDKWYPLFQELAIEAVIIPIPNNVLQYFRRGELVIPIEAVQPSRHHGLDTEQHYTVDWDSADESPELEQPNYPEFSAKVKDGINTLGGEVFVKMNWNSPKDAAWITSSKTLKCTALEDIYLLLKGSEVISEDVNFEFKRPLEGCSDSTSSHCVVLKRWTDMHPGSEFRCFVKNKELVAISQRDCSAYYRHIDVNRYDIMEDILKFFRRNVKEAFPLRDYTFDIFRNDESIVLVDFNPYNEERTKSLLFTWNEIDDLASGGCHLGDDGIPEPEFRFLAEDPGLQAKVYKHYGIPFEVEELCSRQRSLSLIDYVIGESERQNADSSE